MKQVKAIKTFTSTRWGNVEKGKMIQVTDEEQKRLEDLEVIEKQQQESKGFNKK